MSAFDHPNRTSPTLTDAQNRLRSTREIGDAATKPLAIWMQQPKDGSAMAEVLLSKREIMISSFHAI
jgi:hypothetical protein